MLKFFSVVTLAAGILVSALVYEVHRDFYMGVVAPVPPPQSLFQGGAVLITMEKGWSTKYLTFTNNTFTDTAHNTFMDHRIVNDAVWRDNFRGPVNDYWVVKNNIEALCGIITENGCINGRRHK